MVSKKVKVWYWIVLIIFVAFILLGAVSEIMYEKNAVAVMVALGYPVYSLSIIGLAKILGCIAILQNKYKTVKEWAYAGFTIDFIGASASYAFVGAPVFAVIFPIIVLGIMFIAYFLWKKMEKAKVSGGAPAVAAATPAASAPAPTV